MNNSYGKLIKRATNIAIIFAVTLIAMKWVAWYLIGSVSLLASLFDSSFDLLTSCINFVLIRYALKPPDDDHLFGHGKAESLAVLVQSAFIVGSVIFFFIKSLSELIHPTEIKSPELGIVISLISAILTLGLVLYQRHVVRLTNSSAIKADMLHYSVDLLMNITVVIALSLSLFGFPKADAIFGLLICCYILYSAISMIYNAIQDLLDKALPESDNQRILTLSESHPKIFGVHDLKTRKSGKMIFIQLHIELDDKMLLIDAHTIADEIEAKILSEFPSAEVLIHQDPISVVPQEKLKLRAI